MFESKLINMLKEGEELVRIVRKYPLVFFWQIVTSAFFIIAPFFFLYPLFHWSSWGVVIFFVAVCIGVLIALRIVIVYSLNVFIITSDRIIDIDQRGFFDRTVSETTYDKIQDVSFRIKGIGQTILHYGSVIIQTAGAQANIELDGVREPSRIQQIIIDLQREQALRPDKRGKEAGIIDKQPEISGKPAE